MYLTYSEYQTMGGSLTETVFTRAETKAEYTINKATHNRIKGETTVRECVKQACFELIGLSASYDAAMAVSDAGIASQSNDGVSASYQDAATSMCHNAARQREILLLYLADEHDANGVPLMYAGVDQDVITT